MEGWIKLHRQICEWEWYTEATTARLFFHLLLNTNHGPANFRGIIIERGQLITSSESLAGQLRASRKSIRTSLERLKKTGEVAIKSTNKFSIITILKWNDYQTEGQQKGQQRASKGPAKGQQNGHKQEEKNVRMKEKEVARQEALPFFNWLPEEQWAAFKEMRRRIRKPMTLHAEKLAIGKLQKFHAEGKDVAAILDYNILNNYQGLFEPKGDFHAKPTKLDLIAEGIAKARAKRRAEEQGQAG